MNAAEQAQDAERCMGDLLYPAVILMRAASSVPADAAERAMQEAARVAAAAWHSIEDQYAGDYPLCGETLEAAQADCVVIIGMHQMLQARHSDTTLPVPDEAVPRALAVLAKRAESDQYRHDDAR